MRQKRAEESALKQMKSKQRKKDLAREKMDNAKIIFLNFICQCKDIRDIHVFIL